MTIHWGWTALTLVLTGALLAAQWVVSLWAMIGTGLGDLAFWGLALVLLVSVVINMTWPSVLVLNAALIWFLVDTSRGDWLTDLGRSVILLAILNLLLFAIFYARGRAAS